MMQLSRKLAAKMARCAIGIETDENTIPSMASTENTSEVDSRDGSCQKEFSLPQTRPSLDQKQEDTLDNTNRAIVEGCSKPKELQKDKRRKKMIQTLFSRPHSPLASKSLVESEKLPQIIHIPITTGKKRSRVSFGINTTYVVEGPTEDSNQPATSNTWYSDEEFQAMKLDVVHTVAAIVRCHRACREFAETESQTIRGLEQHTSRELIWERKLYKVASRHAVFDAQEYQRVTRRQRDPEAIRELYVAATLRAREHALELGRGDEQAARIIGH